MDLSEPTIKKDMTVYELAILMMDGFERMEKRFEKRFDDLERHHETRIDWLEDQNRKIKKSLKNNFGVSIS